MISLINDFNSSHISLVSDDRDVIDLKENWHMDYLVRTAISFGLPPIRAIQMASINTARYFGLKNMGAIAPGFRADFILLDNLESFIISEVFLGGKRIDTNSGSSNAGGKIKGVTSDIHVNNRSSPSSLSILQNTIHIKALDDPNMFTIPKSTKCSTSLLVIGVIPGQIITQKRIIEPKVNEDYCPVADAQRDIAKLAVNVSIERHHRTGN
ncbi:MAG TPA: amidohydrolase family protein [Nitrososphaeraceae archaeon]|nr:amidohydrolase family protein [Nitrososphaeraceae archaeon]